ncbi:MAG: hypothetical protein CMJ62_12750 [Planctomycetaceae bacterium]|jgi:hypothetical protein|nr:hypothetical protein [Planctomycetaceae bacterium]
MKEQFGLPVEHEGVAGPDASWHCQDKDGDRDPDTPTQYVHDFLQFLLSSGGTSSESDSSPHPATLTDNLESCGIRFPDEAVDQRHVVDFAFNLLRPAAAEPGQLRRDCLDHMIVLNEQHLKQFLSECFEHCPQARTHW